MQVISYHTKGHGKESDPELFWYLSVCHPVVSCAGVCLGRLAAGDVCAPVRRRRIAKTPDVAVGRDLSAHAVAPTFRLAWRPGNAALAGCERLPAATHVN